MTKTDLMTSTKIKFNYEKYSYTLENVEKASKDFITFHRKVNLDVKCPPMKSLEAFLTLK